MTAPNTAYFNNDNTNLILHKVAVATRAIKFPLLGTAYPTPAEFRDKFYCDFLFEALAKKDGSNNVSKVLISGVIEGGAMSTMHNANRHSNLVVSKKNANGTVTKVIILNDGGLNTLGIAEMLNTLSYVFTSYRINFYYKSAFYLSSTEYGLQYRWRNEEDTAWESWNMISMQSVHGAVPSNSSSTIEQVVPIKRPTTHLVLAQVKPFYTNAEGTKEGAVITLYPTLKPIQLQLNGWTNNPTTYWVNDDEIIAGGNESTFTGLWASSDMSGGRYTTNMQLWKDARFYYTYGYNVPEDVWCFLSLVDSNPPGPDPTYTTYGFVFYKSNTSLTIEEISDEMMSSPTGPGWMTGTIYSPLYPSPNEGKWYTTDSLTTLVSNGWYVQGNYGVGATHAYKIISGEVVEEWSN